MAEGNGSSNTAIFAILIIVLLVLGFFFFYGGMGTKTSEKTTVIEKPTLPSTNPIH